MALISRIRGISGNLLSFLGNGPNIKCNNNTFEFRNANDDGYVVIRAANLLDGSNSNNINDNLIYGDGYSGNLVMSGSTEYYITGVELYDTISVASGFTGHLNCMGHDLVCRTLDLRNAAAGTIRESVPTEATNATNSGEWSAGSVGVGGSVTANTGYLYGGVAGTNGAAPPSMDGTQVGLSATAGTSYASDVCNGGNGGNGGTGGSANGTSGGSGTGGATRLAKKIERILQLGYLQVLNSGVFSLFRGGLSAAGGGSGGTYSAAVSGPGGGGGYSRGVMRIRARTIITDGTTAAGAISVRGGNGSNGGAGWAPALNQPAGGGAGGGGGGAGFVDLTYAERVGTPINLVDISGGTGGNGGAGDGTNGLVGGGGYSGGRGSALIRCTGSGSSQMLTIFDGGITHVAPSGSTGASNAYFGTV